MLYSVIYVFLNPSREMSEMLSRGLFLNESYLFI